MNKGVAEQIGTPVEVYENWPVASYELYRQPGDEPVGWRYQRFRRPFRIASPRSGVADWCGYRGHADVT